MNIYRLLNPNTGSSASVSFPKGDADLEAALRNVVAEAFERSGLARNGAKPGLIPEVLHSSTAEKMEAMEDLLSEMTNALSDLMSDADRKGEADEYEGLLARSDRLLGR
jgi:hypothetical protein